jgi:Fe-S-cluster containining protein
MDRQSQFSYQCGACGRCCHNQVISLGPAELLALARASGIATGAARARFTERRGSLLRFRADGGCAALEGARCSIHPGRPLACRIYPLGLERAPDGDRFIRLEPTQGSVGQYGIDGAVGDYLTGQGVDALLGMAARYRPLIAVMSNKIETLVDFGEIEPREFWRRATAEALRESNYDANRLIDALFDPDGIGAAHESVEATIAAHVSILHKMVASTNDPAELATAAVLLAVSLGYSPAEAVQFSTLQ